MSNTHNAIMLTKADGTGEVFGDTLGRFSSRLSDDDFIACMSGNWPCRDLTQLYADEIANYSDEWQWIQARLNAHNIKGLLPGDYIPINVAANGNIPAEVHKAQIAGIDTYYGISFAGDNPVKHHIDWITEKCYSKSILWNTSNNNNATENIKNPFLSSNINSVLNNEVYPLLDTKLRNIIKLKKAALPTRYSAGSTLTDDNDVSVFNMDNLWLPFEVEVLGCSQYGTPGFGGGCLIQYPIFKNNMKAFMKDSGNIWWTASVSSGSSSNGVAVWDRCGGVYSGWVAFATPVPICFRTMED